MIGELLNIFALEDEGADFEDNDLNNLNAAELKELVREQWQREFGWRSGGAKNLSTGDNTEMQMIEGIYYWQMEKVKK